jgi:hypothetical protein
VSEQCHRFRVSTAQQSRIDAESISLVLEYLYKVFVKDMCLGYVLPISNKGLLYPFDHPLPLLLGPACSGYCQHQFLLVCNYLIPALAADRFTLTSRNFSYFFRIFPIILVSKSNARFLAAPSPFLNTSQHPMMTRF